MKHASSLLLCLLLGASLSSAVAQVQVSIGTGDSSISWTDNNGTGSPDPEDWEQGPRDESNLVDDSGLSLGSNNRLVHAQGDSQVASNISQQTGGLLIDLGANFTLGTMQIWSFNDWNDWGNYSPSTFDLYYTADSSAVSLMSGQIQVADLSKFIKLTDNTPLAAASYDSQYLGETYTFGGGALPGELGDQSGTTQSLSANPISSRYLFFNDLTGTDSWGGRLGFSEIRVYTSASAQSASVPEPSQIAASLLLVSGLGIYFLRRRMLKTAS